MQRCRRYLLLALCVAVVGCSGVRVSQDYVDPARFAALETYGWNSAEQPQTGDIRVDNQLLDQRIRKAVDQALAAKGYAKPTEGSADFQVGYELGIRSKVESSGISSGVGIGMGHLGRYGGVGVSSGTTVSQYDEALLVITLFDPGGTDVLWRGTGTVRVTEHTTPEKTDKAVGETVNKILEQFPPK